MNPESINELEYLASYCKRMNNNTILYSIDAAIEGVLNKRFIVGSYSNSSGFSIAKDPTLHTSRAAARLECNRLSKMVPGKLYIFLELSGAEITPVTVATNSY